MNLLDQASSYRQIRKGANEVTKALNRGIAKLVVLAADSEPIEFLLHIPLLCEDKDVAYIFVRTKRSIGRACGISRDVIACAVTTGENSPLNPQIKSIYDEIMQKCLS